MVLHHFEYTAEIPYLQVYTLRDKEYSFSSGITPSVFCSFCGKTVDVFALFVMALLLCFVYNCFVVGARCNTRCNTYCNTKKEESFVKYTNANQDRRKTFLTEIPCIITAAISVLSGIMLIVACFLER